MADNHDIAHRCHMTCEMVRSHVLTYACCWGATHRVHITFKCNSKCALWILLSWTILLRFCSEAHSDPMSMQGCTVRFNVGWRLCLELDVNSRARPEVPRSRPKNSKSRAYRFQITVFHIVWLSSNIWIDFVWNVWLTLSHLHTTSCIGVYKLFTHEHFPHEVLHVFENCS